MNKFIFMLNLIIILFHFQNGLVLSPVNVEFKDESLKSENIYREKRQGIFKGFKRDDDNYGYFKSRFPTTTTTSRAVEIFEELCKEQNGQSPESVDALEISKIRNVRRKILTALVEEFF